MARIPEEEIERLKREVSVERLAEARGVKLRRSGKNLIGLCPFHEDTNPSLSIDPVQNIWNCQGACRKGGSVIDWVMHAEGVSFRHAVELLRADKSARVKGIRHTRDKVTKTKTEIRSRWGGGSWQVPGFFHLGGRPFAAYIDQAYSIHVNALGTTTMDANASGTIVGDMAVYPWGQFWLGGSPEWHYAAFEYGDSATGFYPTANRQYAPTPSRWMTPDPANAGADPGDPQSWNMYAYVGNNPMSFVDPMGLQMKPVIADCESDSVSCRQRSPFAMDNGMCSVDGVANFCEETYSLMGMGSAVICPANNCSGWSATMGYGNSTTFTKWVPSTYSQNNGVITITTGHWLVITSDFSAGAGDALSFGTTYLPQAPTPPKKPCTPLANNLQGTPAAGVDTLFDGFNRVTHPLDMLAVNATMFVAAGGQMVAGGMAIAGGCLEPTPFEPLTCLAGGTAGTASIASGAASGAFGVYFFKNVTLPAIKDWGCHE